jgi:hypothetical protein
MQFTDAANEEQILVSTVVITWHFRKGSNYMLYKTYSLPILTLEQKLGKNYKRCEQITSTVEMKFLCSI